MSTVLWVLAVWLVLAAAFTYVLLMAGMRRDERDDLDDELRELIEQST